MDGATIGEADPALAPLLADIRSRAGALDRSGDWPTDDLLAMVEHGVLRRVVPREWGGDGYDALRIHLGYETIATASVSLALILSQRDSAAGLIEIGLPGALSVDLLSGLARNEIFATVGIAQLTTSNQGGTPSLRASAIDEGFRIDGTVPWSTGADHASHVVAGAALEDGRQLLFVLPTRLPGVRVEPPLPLVALAASRTSRIICDAVTIPATHVLRGPTEKALAQRPRSLPLGQAFLATGLCRAGLDLISANPSAAARSAAAQLGSHLRLLRDELLALSVPGRESDAVAAAPQIRGRCNELALRITHTAVALYKGSGLLTDHPAQRLAREAMFLLVWSCPSPVVECTIDRLVGRV